MSSVMSSETLWWPLEPPGKKSKTPGIPPKPSPTPKGTEIDKAKELERKRLKQIGTPTLLTSNWLGEPNILQMRLGGA